MRCSPRGEMHCTERRRGSASVPSSAIVLLRQGTLLDVALDELAGLERREAADLLMLGGLRPARLHAQLGKIGRGLRESRKRNTELRLEAVFERSFAVVLGVVLGIGVAHHQPAQA